MNIELSNLKRESEAALAKNLEAAEKLRSKAQQQREEMAAAQQEEIGEPVSENDFVGLFGGNTPTASDVKR